MADEFSQAHVAHLDYYERTLRTERYSQKYRLLKSGNKVYSQNDEDGIIQEIFRRIGVKEKRFIEFGVQNGMECNSLLLLCSGWSGMWLEANTEFAAEIKEKFASFIQHNRLICHQQFVTAENVNEQLSLMTGEIDLLSIDIDYNDYWVWKALDVIRPRVVIIEYNASLRPPLSLVVPYDANRSWDGSNFFGASLTALEKLGTEKEYSLVGCCFSGVNAFFVRNDLVGNNFCQPYTANNHYEPPRYSMRYPVGHQPGIALYETV